MKLQDMADSDSISPDAGPAGVLNDTLVMEDFGISVDGILKLLQILNTHVDHITATASRPVELAMSTRLCLSLWLIWFFMFSLWCIDWGGSLYANRTCMYFCIKSSIGTQGEVG